MPDGGHLRGAAQALWLTLLFVLPFVWGGGVVAGVAVLMAAGAGVLVLRPAVAKGSLTGPESRLAGLPVPVLIGGTAVLYLVFSYNMTPASGDGLQSLWREALADSSSRGLALGRGLVADRGPLGCLLARPAEASTGAWYASQFLWRLPLQVLLVCLVWGLEPGRRWLLLGLGLVYGTLQPGCLDLFLVVILLVRWVIPVGTSWWKVLVALLVLALLGLDDFACFLTAFGGLALLGLGSLGGRQWKRGLFLPLVCGAAFTLFWELLGQNSMRIPLWLSGAWDHLRWQAWSHGVSVSGSLSALGALCFLMTGLWLLGGGLGLRVRPSLAGFPEGLLCRSDRGLSDLRSRERRLSGLVLLPPVFLLQWHAFTDTDPRGAAFFSFVLLVAVLRAERPRAWPAAVVCVALLGLWLPGPVGAGSQLAGRAAAWFAGLASGSRESGAVGSAPGMDRQAPGIPALMKAMGGANADLLWDAEPRIPRSSLALAPRPVPVSRMTCAERFLLLNRDFYRSAKGPAYVLVRWEGTGDRWCNQEDAWVLAELPVLFEPLLEENGVLLLRRRSGAAMPEGGMGELVEQKNQRWGEEWRLPDERQARQWLRIYLKPSLLGRLRAVFFRPDLPSLVLTDKAGVEYRHRILPGSSNEGLMLQPYVGSQQDLAAFLRGESGHRLRSFRFECPAGHEEYWKPPAAALLRMHDYRREALP